MRASGSASTLYGAEGRYVGAGMSARVLIAGLGDLGERLAFGLANLQEVGELVLAGRAREEGPPFAALLATCGTARVRFVPLDAADQPAVERLLRQERPDLVVQCASLFSPWLIPGRSDPAAAALQRAGFALQLPAQLRSEERRVGKECRSRG